MPSEYVELMKGIADNLEAWAEEEADAGSPSKQEGYVGTLRHRVLKKRFSEILDWLQWHRPNLGAQVQKLYDELMTQATLDDRLMHEAHCVQGSGLSEKCAIRLALRLREIANIAKGQEKELEETKKQYPPEIAVEPLGITRDLLDWDKSFTQEQIQGIEDKITLANNLDELAGFIESADESLQEENEESNWNIGDIPVEDGSVDIFEHAGYSEDTIALVRSSILSAKKLRSELEKVMGKDEAQDLYQKLQLALRLVISNKGTAVLVSPYVPIPHAEHNPAAKMLAALVRKSSKPTERDEWIRISQAASILACSRGTVSRWASEGKIRDNEKKGKERRLSRISVLWFKDEREREDALKDAADYLQDKASKIPERH